MQLSTYLNSLMNFYNTWFMKSIMCHLGNCLQNYPSSADLNEMRLDSKCGLRTHKSSSYDVNWYEKAVPCYKMVFDLICTEIVSGSKSWRMTIRQLRAAILLWIINSEIFFCINRRFVVFLYQKQFLLVPSIVNFSNDLHFESENSL